VFLTKEKETGKYYAMKAIKKDMLLIHHSVHKVMIERNVLAQSIGSPFIANLHSAFTSPVSILLNNTSSTAQLKHKSPK